MTSGRCPVLVAALTICLPAASGAQDRPPPDSAPLGDSAAIVPTRTYAMPPDVPDGPLAPGTRYIFTRDSLRWFEGYTLADLLGTIPGAYVARAGFIHQPHPVTWAGRGAVAIELFWDGVPYLPVGRDSVHADPGRISLLGLQRVEVRVLPATLRVYLVSERHAAPESRSVIRILSGDVETAGYAALFQHQWANGLTLNLRGDFLGTEGARDAPRDDRSFDLWAKLDWTPTPRVGASWQVWSQQYDRDSIGGPEPGMTTARHGRRSDVLFRFLTSTEPGGNGLGVEAGFATTAWDDEDSTFVARTLRQAFLGVRWRRHNAVVSVLGRAGDGYYTSGVDTHVGWAPLRWFVIAGDAMLRQYPGERTARRAHGSASLHAGPVAVVAQVATGELLDAPRVADDTLQHATDAGGWVQLDLGRVAGRAGLVRRDAYAPRVPPGFPAIARLRPSAEATYFVTDVRLAPWRELTLDAWYANPRGATAPADFQPPEHGRVSLTFRSNFFRTFRSGAWDLKVRYGIEYWSAWFAGVDAQDNVIQVPGATFHDLFIQFRIVGFHAFYRLQNTRNTRGRYAPGFDYLSAAQTFGVTWEFAN